MSLILVDGLKDRPGTGGPKFPNGLHLPAGIGITGDGHINMAGVSSFSELSVSGNVTIGGTLTYEDVTNIDVVGVSTFAGRMNVNSTIQANEGINVTAGVGTFAGDVSIADKIIHTGDTNTAIRFPAADTVSAEAAGAERVRIDSTGVGIGTAPAEEVHILAATPTLLVEGTNTASGQIVADVDVRAHHYRKAGYSISDTDSKAEDIFIGRPYGSGDTTAPLVFNFQGTERVRFTSAGKVGIGTDSPQEELTIMSSTPALMIRDSDQPGSYTQVSNANQDMYFSANGASAHANFIFRSGNNGSFEERARIDSSGRFIIGHNANLSEGCLLQVARTNDNTVELLCYSNNANGARINLTKSRSGTIGENTVVQDGDTLGELHFRAADGSNYYRSAAIEAEIDGTPGSSDVPGRLIFATTADGASSQTERLRITSTGKIGINESSPSNYGIHASWSDQSVYYRADSGSVDSIFGSATALGLAVAGTTSGHAMSYYSNNEERLRMDTSGYSIFKCDSNGGTSAIGGFGTHTWTPKVQVLHTQGEAIVRDGANQWGGALHLAKSRGTYASPSAALNGDRAGAVYFEAFDGTDFLNYVGAMECYIDGAPGSNDTPGRLVFSTAKDGENSLTERVRLQANGICDVSGGVIVHSVGNSPAVDIEQQTDANYTCLRLRNFYSSSGRNMISFLDSDGNVVGSIVNDGSNTTYNTSSDYRLKENEVLISDGIERLKLLKPYRFNWKNDPSKTQDGFFAHEVTPAVPEAVRHEKDNDPGEDGDGYQQLDHSKIVPLLTAALQEAIAEIETLKAKVAALESN